MPPKRRRGGANARGRRGRPPKKLQTTVIETSESTSTSTSLTSPIFEQTETSSSNSSNVDEPAQIEPKIKLETKIHKKFGIKYHVPDEVVIPKTSPVLPSVEKMDADVAEIEKNLIENEISEQLHHLEVAEEQSNEVQTETIISEAAEVVNVENTGNSDNIGIKDADINSGVELEYTPDSEAILPVSAIEPETDVEGDIQDLHCEGDEEAEIYYVVEEESESQDVDTPQTELFDNNDQDMQLNTQDLDTNPTETMECDEPETKLMEVEMNASSIVNAVIEVQATEQTLENIKDKGNEKKKIDKTKIIDRPCRKSKRISLRGQPEAVEKLTTTESEPSVATEIKTEDVQILDVTPLKDSIDSIIDEVSTEVKEEVKEVEPEKEEIKDIVPIECEDLITQENDTVDKEIKEVKDVKENKRVKKTPADKKKPGPKPKKIKDSLKSPLAQTDKELKEKPDKKKSIKRQVTFKVQTKSKKVNIKPSISKSDKLDTNVKVDITDKDKTDKTDKLNTADKSEEEEHNIRRSSRIKTISTQKVRSRGKGVVKKDDVRCGSSGDSNDHSTPGTPDDKNVFVTPTSTTDVEHKPVKVKSRWRRSSELEMRDFVKPALTDSPVSEKDAEKKKNDSGEVERRLKQFIHLKENVYLTERISCKEAKKMVCDCFLTEEEIADGEYGCGEDCLNRLLMIECGNMCTIGDRCTNKRFQKMQSATVEAFATEKKGLGIQAVCTIPSGNFILEYVGEVLDAEKFEQRAAEYSKDKNQHYYFMALRADAIIDATMKGNISRFINHSCEPNAETQKWTVNGELRIGFFSKRAILAGEEITFDYQFQRYGKEAQKCFCDAPNCRGWLGEEPDSDDETDDEDDEEDDEDEEDEEEDEELEEGEPKTIEDQGVAKPTTEIDEKLDGDSKGLENKEITIKAPVKKIARVKKEKAPKKERKPRVLKPRRMRIKTRMDRFEDLGLDEEIESLQSTGLKNQAQTLKLSRLMVRAKEPVQRTKLLKLLKKGEGPCRRLFLDYHGLRLIHGWMTDALHLAQKDASMESLRLEILQTLAMLPIPNKTMLQDSKVLPTVEKWSKESGQSSPLDSDSNSPQIEDVAQSQDKNDEENKKIVEANKINETSKISETNKKSEVAKTKDQESPSVSKTKTITEEVDEQVRKSTGMDPCYYKVIPDYNLSIKDELLAIFDDDFVPLEMPVVVPTKPKPPEPKYDILVEIMALALKLLEEWSSLKEVFRIPKKERIEQMKEHEREADRRYKALSVEETDRKRDRYRSFQRPNDNPFLAKDRDRDRMKNNRYNLHNITSNKMSKHERRELFARQAEEEERRRKQDLWNKQNWMGMGGHQDPRMQMQGYDRNTNPPFIWNPQIGQYIPNPHAQMLPHLHPHGSNMVNVDPSFNFFTRPPNVSTHPMEQHAMHPLPPGGCSMLPPNVAQPNMMPANMGTMPPMPNIPIPPPISSTVPPGSVVPDGTRLPDFDDPSKVQFMGPIPPPVDLPPKWKSAKDKYGRPYYYHIKLRIAQWEPPEFTGVREEPEDEESDSTESSSDTSSLTSSSSSEDSDSDDDTKLMQDIKNKFKVMEAEKAQKLLDISNLQSSEEQSVRVLSDSFIPSDDMNISDMSVMTEMMDRSMAEEAASPLEAQIAEQVLAVPPTKKRRVGLVQELIISPRTEEDRLQFREDIKKYKLNKEMVRKQKEIVHQQTKKHKTAAREGTSSSSSSAPVLGDKPHGKPHKKKVSTKVKIKEMEANVNSEESKKIKETFRAAMASVMVHILNPYRKPDCKEGRIMATDDFKHLARKLTHFVMLKEMKHCDRIEELECTESVKGKAKEFVRKYMAKFGEVYKRPVDETETF